ncbi:MAG: hypothetical protein JOY60_13000 [Burkholderiaceae bacterium]|nr:hypothetical protein [Roseateles sp.]MBV8470763.1 hypothetical protein [Burkholderiaceae bacterium]
MMLFATSALSLVAALLAWPLHRRWRSESATLGAESTPRRPGPTRWRTHRGSLLLALWVLAATAALYARLGTPDAMRMGDAEQPQPSPQQAQQAQIEAMVTRLAQRLQTQTQDAAGWRRLAHAYEVLHRWTDACDAYARLTLLTPGDADMLTDYAVTLAIRQGRDTLGPDSEQLIRQALKARPDHLQALALSGSIAFEHCDYQAAAAFWGKVLAAAPAGSELAASLQGQVSKARRLATQARRC